MVPTLALDPNKPDDPAIGICTLGNVNQGKVDIEDLPRITRQLVELQTKLGFKQNHPTSQANSFVRTYHDIGIGVSNHAYWLAKNDWKYGDEEALLAFDRWMEHFQYGLVKASIDLVQKYGSIDTSLIDLDKLNPANRWTINIVDREPELDWDGLVARAKVEGITNAGLSMIPPAESSSIPSNQTSSLEPVKSLLTIKDKSGKNLKQFVPHVSVMGHKYDLAYETTDMNERYFKHISIAHKWIDKGASSNRFYAPALYKDGKLPLKILVKDMLLMRKLGFKTSYYTNTEISDGVLEDEHSSETRYESGDEQGCAGGGCNL